MKYISGIVALKKLLYPMRLKTLIKRILSNLGVLDNAQRLLKKSRVKSALIRRYFYFKMIGVNKKKYLEYFDKTYHGKLSNNIYIHGVKADRYIGFRKIFEELLNKKGKNFTIIETGCARGRSWFNGNSSFLFYEFLNIFGGKLISIDISKENMDVCYEILQENIPKTGKAKIFPILKDSIYALNNISEEADLLYLDSLDLDIENPEPSMCHHLAELKSAKNIISRSKDLLLAVDDNFRKFNIGKGKYILEWAIDTNQEILLDDYQIIIKVNIDNASRL